MPGAFLPTSEDFGSIGQADNRFDCLPHAVAVSSELPQERRPLSISVHPWLTFLSVFVLWSPPFLTFLDCCNVD